MSMGYFISQATICWDCAFATGGCPWSDYLKPVKGWTAKPVHKECLDSYQVLECPLFKRDALNFGLTKLPKEDIE